MTAVSNQVLNEPTALPEALLPAQRRCLVTGAVGSKADLLRFVLSPDGEVTPDVTGRLPGRGLWVSADRAILDQAIAKNLFARAAKKQVRVPGDLAALTVRLLTRRCLELLGLARSAGAVVMREQAILEAQSAGTLVAVILAADAGGDIRKKLSRTPALYGGLTRAELGAALGRDDCAALGLRAHPLTDKLSGELARLARVSPTILPSNECNGKL